MRRLVGIAAYKQLGATLHNKLINMQLHELKLDSTRLAVHDVHGKTYPIKKQSGRYYIQHAHGQLTVTPLLKQVMPFDGSMADYVFNGDFEKYEYEQYKQIMYEFKN